MPRLFRCLLAALAALTLLAPSSASAQRVLVLDDTATRAEAALAAERLGYEVRVTQNVAGLELAYDRDDDWDVLVIDLRRLAFPPVLSDVVAAHVARGRPAILAYASPGDWPAVAELAEVSCEGTTTVAAVEPTEAGRNVLFEAFDRVPVPVPVASRVGETPQLCTPNEGAVVLARFGPGEMAPAAVVLSAGGNVITNLVSFDAWSGAGDGDMDGVLDGVEVLSNQLEAALGARRAGYLVAGTEIPDVVDEWLLRTGANATLVDSPAALTDALEADQLVDGLFVDARFPTAAAAAWGAAVADALDAGLGVVVFGASQAEPGWADALGLGAIDVAAASAVRPADGGIGNVLFSRPQGVSAIALEAPVGVAGFAPSARRPALARDDSDRVVALGDLDRPLVVIGADLDDLGTRDDDEDERSDVSELIENAWSFARGLATVALVDAPDDSALPQRVADAGYYVVPWDSTDAGAGAIIDAPYVALAVYEGVESPTTDADIAQAAVNRATAGEIGLVLFPVPDPLNGPWWNLLAVEATVIEEGASSLQRSASDLSRLFSVPQPTPEPQPVVDERRRLALTSTAPSSAPIRWNTGEAATLSLAGGRVLFNAWSSDGVSPTDTDSDGVADGVELLRAQWSGVQRPERALVLDASGAPTWSEAGTLVGLTTTIVGPADFATTFDAGGFQQLIVNGVGDAALADPGIVSRIAAWAADSRGLVLFATDLDDTPALTDALGITADDPDGLLSIVEPFDGGAGVFRSPRIVPTPMPPVAPLRADPGDVLAGPEDAVIAARYDSNFGPAASLRGPEGTWFINGFDLAERAAADRDGDGLDDRAALVANQMVVVGRAPVPRISAPAVVAEADRANVNASASFDPTNEALSFAWDLDGDGEFDDAEGDVAIFDATLLDGPTEVTVAVRATNESGLSAIASRAITIENVPPTLDLGPPRTVLQGAMATFDAVIIDAALDEHTVVWEFDDGETFEGVSIARSFDALGEYVATVTAMDDDGASDTATLTIRYVNAAPEITLTGTTVGDEGSTFSYALEANDPGADAVDVAWSFGDGNTATGPEVEHVFADDGRYLLRVDATDALGATASATVEVRVDNVAPEIASEAPTTATAGVPYVYALEVVDPGEEDFEFSVRVGPPGMNVNDEGVVTWTPGDGALRDEIVTVRVLDGDGGQDDQTWVLELLVSDRDEGGAPDVCEERFGFDADDPSDDALDPDADGLTVAEECIAGSDPTVYSGPSVPEPVSPIDGEAVTTDEVYLTFLNAEDPDGDTVLYDVEIATDEEHANLVFSRSGVVEGDRGRTRSFVSAELEEDRRYFWRVRGVTGDVVGAWSEPEAFRPNRDNRPPRAPVPESPIDFASERQPVFTWTNTTDPDGDESEYYLEVYQGADTSGPLTFNTDALPPGDGSTSAQAPEPLLENGVYVWRVRARDVSPPFQFGEWSPLIRFVVDASNSAPSAPIPVSPADGDERVDATSVEALEWEASEDIDGDVITYSGDLATTEDFEAPIATFEDLRDVTSYDLTQTEVTLQADRAYWWRVQASDGRTTTPYEVAAFRTRPRNTAPTAPTPLFPLAGATVQPTAEGVIELAVENVVDPDPDQALVYEFVVATDFEVRSEVARASNVAEGDGQTVAQVGPLDDDTYFWRARAFDGDATGPWSAVVAFDVRGASTPAEPQPDAGTDASPTDAGDAGSDGGGGGGGGGGCASAPAGRSAPGALVLALAALVALGRRRREVTP